MGRLLALPTNVRQLKKVAGIKHSSLFSLFVGDGDKSFYDDKLRTGPQPTKAALTMQTSFQRADVIPTRRQVTTTLKKQLSSSPTLLWNKLERLFLASF
jgi:hypothetical protein